MGRRLAPEETKLWSAVTATVRPMPGRAVADPPKLDPDAAPALIAPPAPAGSTRRKPLPPPETIDTTRRRRIERARGAIEATLDLHGHNQIQAEAALRRFIVNAYGEGLRAILVITGRGVQGGGVIRRHAPEWLAAPDLRHIVAGVSEAHQKHGGEGALYIALKRRPME